MLRHLFPLLAAVTGLLPAQDDRDRTTPTAAVWQTNQSLTELADLVNDGWRFTDLEIESTSPFQFTVACVQNTGTYLKTWWYAIGVTGSQLATTVNQNNARIVDLEPYDDNGTTRFVALLISNTGADAKAWWWNYDMTSAQLNAMVSSNNARLTNFERYTKNGATQFAATMISNTGADQRAWGYLYGASIATINANISANNNRIYDIERVGTDSYDVVLVANGSTGHWYYFDLSGSQLTELLQQNVGRLVDVERRSTLLGTRFDAVMLDSANTLERLARQSFLTAPATALGDYGFFLKEVNGPVLAEMRADTTFEPASTMKTVYHAHAMRRVSLGLSSLSTQINKPISCGVPGSNQSIGTTLRQMMENSDNMSTLAISNHYGINNIQSTANALGMTSTSINFTIGCSGPAPENTMTLRDLTRLHETVANGWLGNQRANFYDLMAESLNFPSWGPVDLDDRIDAEAVALGLPNAVRDAFKSELHLAYKPGGIGWTNPGVWTYYFAEGGWMSVPFKSASGTIVPREYTFGVFNYLFTGQSNEIPGQNAMALAELELVWNRVKAAMATWDNFVPGSLTTLIGAGCAGSNGTPSHNATGSPELGATITYRVQNTPPSTSALVLFGFQNVTWNGAPLPVNLAPLGAPNCLLRVDTAVVDVTTASAAGVALFPLTAPSNPSLVGSQLYSQFLVVDPPANSGGFTISNAVRTTLGGWL